MRAATTRLTESARLTSSPGDGVADRHRAWVFGWERTSQDGTFTFAETFRDYYDWNSDDVICYDDFESKDRVARSAAEYGWFWEPSFNALRSARHVVVDGPSVWN